jgi:hypothetical protein
MASATGLSTGDRKVSTQWAMASMPVAAVMPGGRPSVSSGSQSATAGTRWRLAKVALRPSSVMTMAPIETSLPVPAVVGMAISGGCLPILALPLRITSSSSRGSFCVSVSPTPLARSIGEPPPSATSPSQPSCR